MNGSTLFGGAAEYHCLPQFERVGPFLRKCLDTGLWSGDEPRCERKLNYKKKNLSQRNPCMKKKFKIGI